MVSGRLQRRAGLCEPQRAPGEQAAGRPGGRERRQESIQDSVPRGLGQLRQPGGDLRAPAPPTLQTQGGSWTDSRVLPAKTAGGLDSRLRPRSGHILTLPSSTSSSPGAWVNVVQAAWGASPHITGRR